MWYAIARQKAKPLNAAGVCLLTLVLAFLTLPVKAVTLAVIQDSASTQLTQVDALFVNEFKTLVQDEAPVTVRHFHGDLTAESIAEAFEQAYQDPGVDLILAIGFAANQVGAHRAQFPKPTFLPFLLDRQLTPNDSTQNSSNVRNLNYLTDERPFSEDILAFQRIIPFSRAIVLADSAMVDAVSKTDAIQSFHEGLGVSVEIISVAADFNPASDLPANTEVAILTPLPQLGRVGSQDLINALNLARIPSFSLVGGEDIRLGALAAEEYEHDWLSVARFNALNMQSALLGEDISKLPVFYTSKSRLVINMTTADRIGVSPPFDVLHEVETIRTHDDLPEIHLPDAVASAVAYNPQARASELRMLAGNDKVRDARSRLLPQLSLAAVTQQRREQSALSKANAVQYKRTDASLVVEQLLFSEKAWAGLAIERSLQQARSAQHRQTILDTAYNTASAFVKVLQSEAQLRVRQEDLRYSVSNLDIASKRQALGDVGQAEVFRWESELAQARQGLLSANAQWLQAQENLNVLLHYPVQSRFKLSPPNLEQASALLTDELVLKAIERPTSLRIFSDWLVEVGLEQAPELAGVKAQQQAAQRRYDSARRAYWMPDVSLSAQRQRNYGIDANGPLLGENGHDWVVELSARLPLYSGGQRKAEMGQASYEREALAYDELAVRDQLEQGIRAQLHAVAASFPSIDYANKAADTAARNYELIEEAYVRGAADISDIIDAQRAWRSAKESAANARFNFLQDYLALQRRVGEIDLSTDNEKRQRLLEGLRAKLN